MVESKAQGKHTDALREAIRSSLDAGTFTQEHHDELINILDQVDHSGSRSSTSGDGRGTADQGNTVQVYDTVPPHLITITDAAEVHGVTRQAIYQWIEKGLIRESGFVRVGDGGQRNVALLDRAQLTMLTAVSEPDPNQSNLPVYDVLPSGLIDLSSAAIKFGCSRRRLYNWVRRGHLPAVARLKASAPGGGYLVVAEEDIATHLGKMPGLVDSFE